MFPSVMDFSFAEAAISHRSFLVNPLFPGTDVQASVFAICRGMQLLNVACGGTIWQDFSLIPGKTLDHMQQTDVRSDISHKIRIGRTGHLRKCLGTSLYVNSFHHQAVNLTGKGIIVTARACDETIEAIELKDYPFGVGVQWHPECMFRTSPEMRTLFKNFVEHCSVSGE